MASIYDNFGNNYQTYRNKQRLTGAMVDPRVLGAMMEGELNAKYADQGARASRALQEKSIDNSYDIANKNYNLQASMNKAQQKNSTIGNYASILPYLGSIYKMGQDMDVLPKSQSTADKYWDWKLQSERSKGGNIDLNIGTDIGSNISSPFDYNAPVSGSGGGDVDAGFYDNGGGSNWTKLFEELKGFFI